MIHKLAWRIVCSCIADSGYPEENIEIYIYGLECGMADAIQYLLLIVFALVLRCPARILLFCICFTSLKRNTGGYHAPSHFSCITLFTAMAVLAASIAPLPSPTAARIITFACVTLQFILVFPKAPVAHPNHPKSQAAYIKSRKISVTIAALEAFLLPLLSLYQPALVLSGAFGGMAAAVTLIIPNKKVKGGKRK